MRQCSSPELRKVLSCLQEHLPYRQIQQHTGISAATVSRVAARAVAVGISITQLQQFSDDELHRIIYPLTPGRCLGPNWQKIHEQMQRRGVTLSLLYNQFKSAASGPVYTYSSFSRGYSRWKADNGLLRASGNVEKLPGERMEIDFAGDKIEWVDQQGEIHKAKLFVATLPYSCLIFTEAFTDETQQSWIAGIVDALEYFGGAPEVLVMDNAKALVSTAGYKEGSIQLVVRSLCDYYKMEPWACKPRTPKQKNRVEAAVHDVERWIIAQMTLDHAVFASCIEDLNEQIRLRLDEVNNRPFRGASVTGSRRSRYEEEERKHMQALPALPFEYGDWKLLVADKAHCVRIASDGGHRYSVPSQYTGKKVFVRVCRTKVELFDPQSMKPIGTHQRQTNRTGNKTHILDEHLTSAEKHYRRTPDDWADLLTKKGLGKQLSCEFVAFVKNNKGGFPSGRLFGAVCGLFNTFSPQVIRHAVATAMEDGNVSYKYISRLCEQISFAEKTNCCLDLEGDSNKTCIVSTL